MVGGIEVDVVRKAIKNAHLAVYPPTGRVRLAVPTGMSDRSIRLLAISRLGWIRKHQRHVQAQARETPREYVSGESHYFQGRRYLLRVVEGARKHEVVVRGKRYLELHVRTGTDRAGRAKALDGWYRDRLRELASPLFARWEPILGVEARQWEIKRMRTKWGSCNSKARRIWLNPELAKKPPRCLEYIVVHELVHLIERTHNERFIALMDRHLPNWRERRKELNVLPVRHEEWAE